jgi:hypothetical protein
MYGTAEIKKVDTKSMPFDFSLMKQMTTPEFCDNFQTELEAFLSALYAEQAEGNH